MKLAYTFSELYNNSILFLYKIILLNSISNLSLILICNFNLYFLIYVIKKYKLSVQFNSVI